MLELRYYKQECIDAIEAGSSKVLAVLATGAGKSLIMARIPRKGRQLVLVHREDLLYSNGENFEDAVGYEMASVTSNGEDVIIASVQSLANRLDKFYPDYFDLIVLDEAHHYTSDGYKAVVDHFTPRKLVGLTATPCRADGVGLELILDDIVYTKDLKDLIDEGFLCPVKCHKVDVGYDISNVMSRMGDFAISELETQLNVEGSHKAIKEIVYKYDGSYIIACVNVKHAEDLATYLGGIAITADTPNRMGILTDYKAGRVRILTTVNVLSEGSNLPIAKNLIFAAPTQSKVKYIQTAGRVMRLYPGKTECRIFDLVGNVGRHSLCGHHTLIGLDVEQIPKGQTIELIGDLLLDLPDLIKRKSDCPESWINNLKRVEIWGKEHGFNTHQVNYFLHPDGSMVVALADGKWIGIDGISQIKKSTIISSGEKKYELQPTQDAYDEIFKILKTHAKNSKPLWSAISAKRWGREVCTPKQYHYAKGLLKSNGIDFQIPKGASKGDVSCIVGRLKKNGIPDPKRKRVQSNRINEIRFNLGSSISKVRNDNL